MLNAVCGFLELNDYSVTRLTGADRQSWLNSFCTNDLSALSAGQGCEAFILNVKGKVLAWSLVLIHESEISIICLGRTQTPLPTHLDRYIIREDVQVEDTTQSKALFYVAGPEADQALLKQFGSRPEPMSHGDVAGIPNCAAVANELAADADWLLLLDRSSIATLHEWFRGQTIAPGDRRAFDYGRIEALTPRNGQEASVDRLPQELRRDDKAISFKKGCYLGQETVARIDALGHVNQLLVCVRFDKLVELEVPFSLTSGEQAAGSVTSLASSLDGRQSIGLAMVRRTWAVPGTTLQSTAGEARVEV